MAQTAGKPPGVTLGTPVFARFVSVDSTRHNDCSKKSIGIVLREFGQFDEQKGIMVCDSSKMQSKKNGVG